MISAKKLPLWVMNNNHTKVRIITLASIATIVSTTLLVLSSVHESLLPLVESRFPYEVFTSTDNEEGGSSSITLESGDAELSYTYHLSEGYTYPFTSVTMGFGETLVDWSGYQKLILRIACDPENVILVTLHTFDPEVTRPETPISYRRARTSLSCTPDPQQVSIDFNQLLPPEWWLMRFDLPIDQRHFDASKVFELAFENSRQSPEHTDSKVQITQVALAGRDWRYVLASISILVLTVIAVARWLIKQHTYRLRSELRPKRPLNATLPTYQPVEMDCKSDRERNAVLTYMATHYTNPDLNLETTIQSLGINRLKINDILREHYGLTFSSCLKKLRLTEAARLLREKNASVAEIGFMVGFNNASYFNQSFKKEYDCTPNTYRKATMTGKDTSETES